MRRKRKNEKERGDKILRQKGKKNVRVESRNKVKKNDRHILETRLGK